MVNLAPLSQKKRIFAAYVCNNLKQCVFTLSVLLVTIQLLEMCLDARALKQHYPNIWRTVNLYSINCQGIFEIFLLDRVIFAFNVIHGHKSNSYFFC